MITPYPQSPPNIPVNLGKAWWTSQTHESVLQRLVGPSTKNIIEIGSFVGRSTLAWLRMAPNATIWCIDPWEGDVRCDDTMRYKDHHPEADVFEQFVQNTWDVRERVRMLRMCSKNGLNCLWESVSFTDYRIDPDLIYVDGDHTKQAVLDDIRASKDLFDTSIICGDDFHWTSVNEALQELRRREEIDFIAHGNVWVLDDEQTKLALAGRDGR